MVTVFAFIIPGLHLELEGNDAGDHKQDHRRDHQEVLKSTFRDQERDQSDQTDQRGQTGRHDHAGGMEQSLVVAFLVFRHLENQFVYLFMILFDLDNLPT